jgi:Rrf2 family protein
MTGLNKSTRYALHAALELASRGASEEPVTVASIAGRHAIPAAVLAKVLQQLVRSGIAVGTRGAHGGYRLARPASQVTLAEVIEAFEPVSGRDVLPDSRLREILDEVEALPRSAFAALTLEALAARLRPSAARFAGRIITP